MSTAKVQEKGGGQGVAAVVGYEYLSDDGWVQRG